MKHVKAVGLGLIPMGVAFMGMLYFPWVTVTALAAMALAVIAWLIGTSIIEHLEDRKKP